jgi:hypothetical protein
MQKKNFKFHHNHLKAYLKILLSLFSLCVIRQDIKLLLIH